MTFREIKERINQIEEIKRDDENAHIYEDELYRDFIASIGTRKDSLGEKARLVLTTYKINFERWYA